MTFSNHDFTDWGDDYLGYGDDYLGSHDSRDPAHGELVRQPTAHAWAATLVLVLALVLLIPIWLGQDVIIWSSLGYGAGVAASVLVLITNLTDRKRKMDRNYAFRFNLSPWMWCVRLAACGVSLAHIALLAWNLAL